MASWCCIFSHIVRVYVLVMYMAWLSNRLRDPGYAAVIALTSGASVMWGYPAWRATRQRADEAEAKLRRRRRHHDGGGYS